MRMESLAPMERQLPPTESLLPMMQSQLRLKRPVWKVWLLHRLMSIPLPALII